MTPAPHDPQDAVRRYAEMLDGAGLPRFSRVVHDLETNTIEFGWSHGLMIVHDLGEDLEPIGEWEREAIVGGSLIGEAEPVHVCVPGSPGDPREREEIPGVVVHYTPPLHPDDVSVVDGIPCTAPARTLIDCAEVVDRARLRAMFVRALDMELVDEDELRAARARVEWRASLELFDEVMAEFFG